MAAGTKTAVSHPNPIHKGDRVWLENKDWAAILEVSEFDSFANFHKNFTQYVNKWKEVWESLTPNQCTDRRHQIQVISLPT